MMLSFFFNIPEKSEGRNTIAFVNQLIPLLPVKGNFPKAAVIERAHWSPTFISSTSFAPRPILVKFLHFQDKVRILPLVTPNS